MEQHTNLVGKTTGNHLESADGFCNMEHMLIVSINTNTFSDTSASMIKSSPEVSCTLC